MSSRSLWRKVVPIAAVAVLGIGGTVAATAYAEDAPKQVRPMDASPGKDRIVGGSPVEEEKPWISALHNGGSFTCTSSQIGAEWVITAAHCVEDGGEFSVRIGSLERSGGGTERAVSEVTTHPEYNWPSNDIALLKLAEPFENSYAPMAKAEDVQMGQESMIYGWGSENADWSGPLPEHLKQSAGTTTEEYCDTANVVCMLGDGGVAGGDSGGPGFVKSPVSGEFVQVGVCAVGHDPADTNWGGYTSIPANADWISEVTGL